MKNEIAIQAIRSRPRFRVKTKMTRTEFVNRLKCHMENHKQVIFGFANNEMAELQLHKDSEKYWSPQLQIRIEENEENSDLLEIRGVFGPRSSVWTFFMFLYGLGGAIILTVGIYGWVEFALGVGNFWVWTNLLGVLLILIAYLASRIGQKLSQSHLKVLRAFIETVLIEEKILRIN